MNLKLPFSSLGLSRFCSCSILQMWSLEIAGKALSNTCFQNVYKRRFFHFKYKSRLLKIAKQFPPGRGYEPGVLPEGAMLAP